MKVNGLTLAQFHTVLTLVDPALCWSYDSLNSPNPTSLGGYLYYHQSASTTFRCYKNGAPLHKPCYHAVAKVVGVALDKGAKSVWAEKLKFTKFTTGPLHFQKLRLKFAEKGLTCMCPTQAPVSTKAPKFGGPGGAPTKTPSAQLLSTSSSSSAKPPVADPVVSLTLDAQPLVGDAVTDGEANLVPKVVRGVSTLVGGLYTLLAISQALATFETESGLGNRVVGVGYPRWDSVRKGRTFALRMYLEELNDFRADYEERAARNLFDYLTIASYGEARHSGSLTWTDGRPTSRSEAYAQVLKYDPRTVLPVLERVFAEVPWGSNYGGPKWANIVRSTSLYFKLRQYPLVFADHCVDLSHNGGLAFNKGYILSNPPSHAEYMKLLDAKRDGDFLARDLHVNVSPEVMEYVRRAVEQGIIRTPRAKLTEVDDTDVPILKWGTTPFQIGVKHGTKIGTSSPAPVVQGKVQNWESYPESRRA